MTNLEALYEVLAGKQVRQKQWHSDIYLQLSEETEGYLEKVDFMSDDWYPQKQMQSFSIFDDETIQWEIANE